MARKIEDSVPAIMPMNKVSAMSRRVPAPRMKAPTTSSEATGSTPTTEVLIERMKVWLTARLASSAYVERVCAS